MDDQLELSAAAAGDETAQLRVGVPVRLHKLIRRLEPSARSELEQRLAVAFHTAYTTIADIRSLSADELIARLVIARRDVEVLSSERDRRATARTTCRECAGPDGLHDGGCTVQPADHTA